MKKIIPFKKDIIFKTNLAEITSISLEHNLDVDNNDISGSFIVSGEYKIADTSINVESFSYDLPFHISMDERYILDDVKIDIDDFYYEIINSNILSVNIEVLIDKLEEKELVEEDIEEINQDDIFEEMTRDEIPNIQERDEMEINILEEKIDDEGINIDEVYKINEDSSKERCIEDEDTASEISSLFDNMDATSETYKSYKVYIVRDGDNLESIIEKYSITKETLEEYNDLKELKIGDKIIIPS